MPHFQIIETRRFQPATDTDDAFDFNFAPNEPQQTREHILLATRPDDGDDTSLPAVQPVREAARRFHDSEDDGGWDAGDYDGNGQVGFSDFMF